MILGVLGRSLTPVAWERKGQGGVTIQVESPSLEGSDKCGDVALGDR